MPLRAPMSEVAGRMAAQVGARLLEKPQGGRGVLLGGVPGVAPGKTVVLGATAHVEGDIVHQDIRIESGAYIDGHCKPEYGKTAAKPAQKSTDSAKA